MSNEYILISIMESLSDGFLIVDEVSWGTIALNKIYFI